MSTSTPTQPRRVAPTVRARRTAFVVALGVALFGSLAWLQVAERGLTRQSAAFERVVDQSMLSIRQQTALYRNALLGLRAAFRASDELDAREFALYVDALQIEHNLSGLRAFALNRDLSAEALPAHLAWMRRELFALDATYADLAVAPPGERMHYHLVELIRPAAGNSSSLGYDLWSNPERRHTIELARANGFAATPPIRLRQEPSSLSVLLLAPVNAAGAHAGGPERDTVAASFRANDMVNAALSETLRRHFVLSIHDIGPSDEPGQPPQLLYQEAQEAGERLPLLGASTVLRVLDFGGRRWQLAFVPVLPPGGLAAPVAAVLLIGSLSLLSGAVTYLAMQRRQRAARMSALARLATDCVFCLDERGIVREANGASERVTGRPGKAWLGQPLCAGALDEDRERVADAVRLARDGKEAVTVEFRTRDDGHGNRWIAARIGNHLANPHIRAMLVQLSDIDARKHGEHTIARMAFFDPLTDLPNRRLLEERAEITLASAHRSGGRVGVLVLDLDGFKAVNDSAGHAVGDEVLKTVAHRLIRSIRENDTAARLGGDEFVVLLADPAGIDEARSAAGRIASALSEPVCVAGQSWLITASIGIALYPDAGDSLTTLLRTADEAMYGIKHSGRDGYAIGGMADDASAPPPERGAGRPLTEG